MAVEVDLPQISIPALLDSQYPSITTIVATEDSQMALSEEHAPPSVVTGQKSPMELSQQPDIPIELDSIQPEHKEKEVVSLISDTVLEDLYSENQHNTPVAPIEPQQEQHQPTRQEPTIQEIPTQAEIQAMLIEERAKEASLRKAKNAASRDAETLTEEMKSEVIALIQAFDLPYVIAPFEAEAQCAVLESLGLVDGVVTEDSDAFLFGAQVVYRNIFNDRKFVEAYMANDIKQEVGLSRKELITLAFLLGSDYTEGVHGVGIVNAMEIIQAFPCGTSSSKNERNTSDIHDDENNAKKRESGVDDILYGLKGFKDWLDGYDFRETLHDMTKEKSKKKKMKKKKNRDDACDDDDEEEMENKSESKKLDSKRDIFHNKHKSGRSKWTVGTNFPDRTVAEAFLQPAANYDSEKFNWSIPKLHTIRTYCAHSLGWTDEEMDRNVDPVLLRYTAKTTQPKIASYFMQYQDANRSGTITSERLQSSVAQISGKDISAMAALKNKNKKKSNSKKTITKF